MRQDSQMSHWQRMPTYAEQNAEMARAMKALVPAQDERSLLDQLFHLEGDTGAALKQYYALAEQLTAHLTTNPLPTDKAEIQHLIEKHRLIAHFLEQRTALAFRIFFQELGKVIVINDKIYNEIIAVHKRLEDVDTAVQGLKTSYNAMEEKVDQIMKDVTAMRGEMNIMKGDITLMQADITELKGKVDTIGTDVGEVKGLLNQLIQQNAALQTQLTQQNAALQRERDHNERYTWITVTALAEEAKFSPAQMCS
ncbi:uncharacterized protein LOC129598568 [Paramacrobiotus metropolitanus]|uniref:uncharacterized protein LOC129598568 n=1 Tax=Paramacrobiotus metropolitanus TaxID=2943436 RepID=UPI0024464EE1|nr:uncharacterized protein LOC129598568 [Paramacrobiotus metropolitanus]XP_055352513.1 uncharacterized protein LOC129598568 [Paramacrobiotus metropolitanus]XP_055352514.1 uncharacterized protein LOC129598568 [Paramacrobiotus metropolitanus]XP_055352515.1 uncharacterized protein LOC129598568 [Paramacrobiotus metropolitanus]XP_055352516.1 uncharacterized protein LOC129598568 [Paramacrobiotus metropolitanus]XP_055352517.1 uncharacterized protein LOC129598568 [Paramacrobiotus metropolitanus]